MKLLCKYPTRQRADQFRRILDKYYQKLSNKHPYQFLITVDTDDDTMNNPEMISFLKSKPNLVYNFGNSKTKIEAVNNDMNLADSDFDILCLLSDDMTPEVQGFDDIIVNDMKRYHPNLDGALFYPDGFVNFRLNTLSIIGRKLYEYFGYIYHKDYISFYCDEEWHNVVEKMGKLQRIDKCIIKHKWNSLKDDALHKKNDWCFEQDKETFNKRKSLGFPKESILTK